MVCSDATHVLYGENHLGTFVPTGFEKTGIIVIKRVFSRSNDLLKAIQSLLIFLGIEINFARQCNRSILCGASVVGLIPCFGQFINRLGEVFQHEFTYFFNRLTCIFHITVAFANDYTLVINGHTAKEIHQCEVIKGTHELGFCLVLYLKFVSHLAAVYILQHAIGTCNPLVEVFPFVQYPIVLHIICATLERLIRRWVISHCNTSQTVHGKLKTEDIIILHLTIDSHHGLLGVLFVFIELLRT